MRHAGSKRRGFGVVLINVHGGVVTRQHSVGIDTFFRDFVARADADIALLGIVTYQLTLWFEAALLRGAMKDTAEYLYRLTTGGIMERNAARAKLDMNPIAGLDEPLTPTNMTNDPSGAPATGGTP